MNWFHVCHHLDLDGEDLPWDRYVEVQAQLHASRTTEPVPNQSSHRLRKKAQEELRRKEVVEMVTHAEPSEMEPTAEESDINPTILESSGIDPTLQKFVNDTKQIQKRIHLGYIEDNIFSKVINHPKQHLLFEVKDGLVYVKNKARDTTCVSPRFFTINKASLAS